MKETGQTSRGAGEGLVDGAAGCVGGGGEGDAKRRSMQRRGRRPMLEEDKERADNVINICC